MITPAKSPHLAEPEVNPAHSGLGRADTVKEAVRLAREHAEQHSRSVVWRIALGGLVGGVLGFAYYFFVGCSSGHCLIGANPFLSSIFGGLFGLSLAALVFPPKR